MTDQLRDISVSTPMRLLPAIQLILAAACWGGVTVWNKALLSSLPPVALLMLQLAPSVVVAWLAVVWSGARWPEPSVAIKATLLGFLNPGISYTLALVALTYLTASVVSVLWASEPLIILGLAALFLEESITPKLVAVLLLGFLGVLLVTNAAGVVSGGEGQLTGVVLMLLTILCCSTHTIVSRKISDKADPLILLALQMTAGLVWTIVLSLAAPRFGSLQDVFQMPVSTIAAAKISGLLYFAFAYGFFLSALRTVPASIAGSYLNLIPVVGVTLAFLVLAERFDVSQWLGAGAVLVSALLLVRMTPSHD